MNLFSQVKEAKSILDLITFDLTTFFQQDDYEEIYSEEILDTILIDYEKRLPWKEFQVFSRVIFHVFIEKTNITGSNHINVAFYSDEAVEADNLQNIISKITKVYGIDDNRRGYWGELDNENFGKKKITRMWTLGRDENIYSIRLNCNEKGEVQLTIMFFTNLLKHLNKL